MPTNHSQNHRTVAYLDGFQLLYRAEYGFPTRIRNRAGDDVTGLFGSLALLRKALWSSQMSPTHALVVFDADAPTHRSRLDARYRAARRAPRPEDGHTPFRHLPWLLQALEVWPVAFLEPESAEADDVIASLLAQRSTRSDHSIVVSRDKDFHQLVSARVSQWDPARGGEKGWVRPETIYARYGVGPEQWCDYVALVGDRSDGMPGVKGIGPVTAARLLGEGRRLEDLAGELPAATLAEARSQRSLHRLLTDVRLPPSEASPLPADGLPPAAAVLDSLGIWGARYP